MKLEQASYSVNNSILIKESVSKYVSQRTVGEKSIENKILGDILSDIRYTWLARGPTLEVFHSKSSTKVASWTFRISHDFEACVNCVVDLPSVQSKMPLLVVGLECEVMGGMICVFDVASRRVIRAIQIDDRVTSIHVVSTGSESSLPGVLSALDGIIAVGTGKGKVYLVDLCRQICEEALLDTENEVVRDESNPCQLTSLSYHDLKNLESHKEKSLNTGKHLRFQLNERSTSDIHFTLWGPSGDIRLRANKTEVTVSALHWCPALGSLLVGYNFGCFQLYNLLTSNLVLDYTSPLYEDCIPVSQFAFQEPCDDPRTFCYVWVTYSVTDNGDSGDSMAVMYSLNYKEKDWLEGYGVLYQELVSCSVRFQMEFAKVIDENKYLGARCISLRSYTRPLSRESPEERLALCTLIWTCWKKNSDKTDTYLALFDLNQWYKEQMPTQPRSRPIDNERYMDFVSLNEILDSRFANDNNILDLRIDSQSLSPFICPQRLEEHYYPSALSFRTTCLFTSRITHITTTGAQRYLLSQLKTSGPLCLLQPNELYHRCITLGLTGSESSPLTIPQQQRTVILCVALEHELVQWLCQCVKEWANGAQAAAGCTLDWMLDWAWQKAMSLKFQTDKLCIPLFDYTGERLDGNALASFNHNACQLKCLTTIFETVVKYCEPYFSDQDMEDIYYQHRSLQMLSTYLEVLQWLLNVGLLPECPLSMYPRPDEVDRISAPYPVESLSRFYDNRRKELLDVQSGSGDLKGTSLLFIDNLMQLEFGNSILSKQWQCDGGSGLYPPPSLQALLRTYLVEDIDLVYKHSLFIYVFLDLAMTLDQSRYKSIITHLIKFPAVFKLSPSIIKMTQAFWQLDHGDFSTAMSQLLDPAVTAEDLKPWHHRTVLKALLLQKQHQHALLYHQVRKPPISNVQDICIIITLLILNNLLKEAFHFQRQNRSVHNEKEILNHFFSVSAKLKQLREVVFLPLCSVEEQAFTTYLKKHPTEDNNNFLIIYYLQRDRYAEAFEINDSLNSLKTTAQQGLLGQQNKSFRNVIVAGFKKTLPNVSQELYEFLQKTQKEKETVWRSVDRPVPMSVFIHDTNEQVKYKSTLIQASLQKAKETWSQLFQNKKIDLEETPFVSTPKVAQSQDISKDTTLIYASVMHPNIAEDSDSEMGATPSKRMRLSPRQSTSTPTSIVRRFQRQTSNNESLNLSLLDTPIVKRKSYRTDSVTRDAVYSPTVGTPTSILKVRSLLRQSLSPNESIEITTKDERGTSTTPEILEEIEQNSDNGVLPLDRSSNSFNESSRMNLSTISSEQPRRLSPLGICPRRPIQRSSRPAVHFEDASRPGSRSSEESISSVNINQQIEVSVEVHQKQTPNAQPDTEINSLSTEETFYSTNTSLSDSNNTVNIPKATEAVMNDSTETRRTSLKRKASDSSIKSRRSYKSTPSKIQLTNSPKTRSSVRARESLTKVLDSPKTVLIPVEKSSESISKILETSKENSPRKSDIFPKLGARRSLSRQVLEQNTLSRAKQQPNIQTSLSLTKIPVVEDIVGVEMSFSKTVTSIVKKSSDSVIEETCDKNTVETKNVFTTERDPESSAQIIKHIHNESNSKSSVKKVTEILQDDSNNQISLSTNIDTDESYVSSEKENPKRSSGFHVLSLNNDAEEFYELTEKESVINKKNMSTHDLTEEEINETNAPNELTDYSVRIIGESTENDSTIFEDISTVIIDESIVSVDSQSDYEEKMDISEINLETDEDVGSQETEEQCILIESEEQSCNSEERVSIHSVESNVTVNVEEEEENDIEEEENIEKDEEEEESVLSQSSNESSDVEEKLSNREEEQEEMEEQSEKDASDESDQETESSQSPKIIEIDSSSEESCGILHISKESKSNENILDESAADENNLEENGNEEIIETDVVETIFETNILEEIVNTEEDIKEMDITEQEVVENVVIVEEIQQEVEEFIEIPADVQLEIEEIMESEEQIIENSYDKNKSQNVEVEDTTKSIESKELVKDTQQIVKEDLNTNQMQNVIVIIERMPEINTSQQTTVVTQQSEEGTQNVEEATKEISKANIPQESMDTSQAVQKIPESETSYTPCRRSKRLSSKQELQSSVEKTTKITRKRSMSVDVDVKSEKSPIAEKELSTSILGSRRKRSTSVNIEAESIPKEEESRKLVTKEELLKIVTSEKESTPNRRITRKRSTSIDVEANPPAVEEEIKPSRRSTRKCSTSIDTETNVTAESELKLTRRVTRRRSSSIDTETKSASTEEKSKSASRSTRKQSTSIDADLSVVQEPKSRSSRRRSTTEEEETPKTPQRSIRTRRSSSTEPEDTPSTKEESRRRSTRASSVVNLPIIEEETQENVHSHQRKKQTNLIVEESEDVPLEEIKKAALDTIPEKIEEYSATHRLTRRQKSIMEKSLKLQEMKKLQSSSSRSHAEYTEENRPGTPEEHRNRSISPASSTSTRTSTATTGDVPSTPKRKRGESSISSSISTPDTPKRRSQQTSIKPVRRSTRTLSRETVPDDVASVKSVSSVPAEEEEKKERTRYRSLSPTAFKQETISSPRTRRSTKTSFFPSRTDLTKISEETASEHSNQSEGSSTGVKEPQSKRIRLGHSKKSGKESTQSSQSSQDSNQSDKHRRMTTYKPLSDYAPRHAALFKTRKVYKIKK